LSCLSVLPTLAAADVASGIVEPYLRIQASLAGDSMAAVKDDAGLIATEAAKLGAAGKPLVDAATELKGAAALAPARAAFGRLSDALIKYSESAPDAFGTGLNVAFCPMVNKSWIQKGRQISNPYAGKEMLRCGEIVKPVKGS
jgi:Cu(I)/Ag(I) efflux system membrane fusion protein